MKIDGLSDAAARAAIRSELDSTLVVEAAAGTGKTTELVQRVVAVVAEGRGRLESLVAVTFTEKAAGEMKLRLRTELERSLGEHTDGTARTRLQAAIAELESARIGTIHAFCHDILRERPVEAGVDPGFEVLEDAASRQLLGRAFDEWLERTLSDPPEGIRRVIRREAGAAGGIRPRLRSAAYQLANTRDFDAPYRRDPFDRSGAIDAVLQSVARVGALAERAADRRSTLAKNLQILQRFARRVEERERVGTRDYDALEAALAAMHRGRKPFKHRGSGKHFARDLMRDDVLAQREALRIQLEACVEACDADLAACLRGELWPVVDAYGRAKAAQGALDFFDLLLCTRDLLHEHGGVRRELCERFSHLFLDEFQDTDPVQTEIMLLLSTQDGVEGEPWSVVPSPGKLFLVGDPKQSIYRFRRADVRFYERVKRFLTGHGARLLSLSTSFRSSPGIQSLVNASFAPHMTADPELGRSGYVALDAFRPERDDQPSVVALPVPLPYASWGGVTNKAVDASLPEAVGAWVQWLVAQSGWTVDEGGERVPVAARHVCLLFRRTAAWKTDVVQPYVRALEARHIHHVRGGGRSFHEREEVLALRVALAAIEWPDDSLSVYAALRGPLFALGDDMLLQLKTAAGALHPLKPYDLKTLPKATQPAVEALALLGALHVGRNHQPVQHVVLALLHETRAHAAVAIWPTGEQALGNLLRVTDQARTYQQTRKGTSFRGFVEWLEAQAAEGESEEAPVIEEGDDGVRIMTVHGAKGLEFPVVILCDPNAPLRRRRPSRWVDDETRLWAEPIMGLAPRELLDRAEEVLDQDEAEEIRLAYVAATRAREVLVVPVVGDRPPLEPEWMGWLDVLRPGLFPPPDLRRDARPAPGCPAFGDDSVLARPERADRGARASVAPGRHRAEAGHHDVVFWDPGVLKLDVRAVGGLRQQELLKAPKDGAQSAAQRAAYEGWRESWRATLAEAARPSVNVETVTARAAKRSGTPGTAAAAEPRAVKVERCERESGRPRGARFGTLVHAVLEHAHPDADEDALSELAGVLGREGGASAEEVAAAVQAGARALAHPLMARVALAEARGEVQREAPLLMRDADGQVLEGIVDLAFREAGAADEADAADAADARWVLVDYKTDHGAAESEVYRHQLSLYAAALEAITGEPAECVLFLV